jgi:hypothetical protein
MVPQRSSSTKSQQPKGSGGLRQGTLSFASAKRSGSTSAKDSLKGKAVAVSPVAEAPVIAPIRIGGKRKYEPEPEPERESAEETTEVVERESLDPNDSRWNKAYGLARAKMGNIQSGPSFLPCGLSVCLSVSLAEWKSVSGTVHHTQDETPVHHILRVFDLYVTCHACDRDLTLSNTAV